MDHELDPLVLDLVEWVARERRSYREVLDVWRTSCPRLTVWEDAIDRGFLTRKFVPGHEAMVEVTSAGYEYLATHGRHGPNAEQGAMRPVRMPAI